MSRLMARTALALLLISSEADARHRLKHHHGSLAQVKTGVQIRAQRFTALSQQFEDDVSAIDTMAAGGVDDKAAARAKVAELKHTL